MEPSAPPPSLGVAEEEARRARELSLVLPREEVRVLEVRRGLRAVKLLNALPYTSDPTPARKFGHKQGEQH